MNPVLRENLEVFFGEGHVLTVYYYLLIILAPVQVGSLYASSLGEQMWKGSGDLFAVCSVTAFLLIVYFALRVANREYAPERFKPLEHWLRGGRHAAGVVARGQVAYLVVHIVCMLVLSAPLLIWAAAISRTPPVSVAATLALIPFQAFCYGVWGLVASVVWEREAAGREFIIRGFILFLVVAALVVYLPLNPVIYLVGALERHEFAPFGIAGAKWSAHTFHLGFHLALGGAGLIAHRWVLKQELERGRG